MGADSWAEITTWREWEKVLSLADTIVVTRPDYEIGFEHVGAQFQSRIVDLRNELKNDLRMTNDGLRKKNGDSRIYIRMPFFSTFRRRKFGEKSKKISPVGALMCRRRLQNMSKNTNFTDNIYKIPFIELFLLGGKR
jgi:hypothetical protein